MDRYLLDVERLKVLEPIMKELGVEAISTTLQTNGGAWDGYPVAIYSYDYASFESVLPDWFFDKPTPREICENVPDEIIDKAYHYRDIVRCSRGQKKLESMADTIILLHENNLLKKQKEKNSNGK